MTVQSNAEAFIDVMNAHGVREIFFNPGGEFIGLQSLVARSRTAGEEAPQLVLCLDEAVAVSAAHAHYVVSGRPQMILVHSELGTLQMGGNLHNLQWGRVPAVIMAAYQADERRTTWKQEPYDQGSIVRNNVKWDLRVNEDDDMHEVLTEAFRIARTDPTGPVYLYFPFDYLSQVVDRPDTPPAPAEIAPLPAPDLGALDRAAEMLLEAANPLIVTGFAGRYPENVGALVRLAETLSARVLTGQVWVNFPTDHPLCLGIEQIGGSRKPNPGIAEADAILAIDYDMPYVGGEGTPSPEARIIHIDVDPLTNGRLLWERGADLFIKADSRAAIPVLDRLLGQRITAERRWALRGRYKQIEAENRKAHEQWRALGEGSDDQSPISPDWLCHCLNQIIDEDTIVVNHTLSHCASFTEQIERTKPGTLLGCPAGAIGWAMGASLGAKLAAPNRTVITTLTDGGFIWGCPTSTLWTAMKYGASFLAVIFNNHGYGVVRGSQKEILGVDSLTEEYAFEAGVEFMPDYGMIARACGAYGRTVEDPADVLPALREALARVRAGQAAVLDVRLAAD